MHHPTPATILLLLLSLSVTNPIPIEEDECSDAEKPRGGQAPVRAGEVPVRLGVHKITTGLDLTSFMRTHHLVAVFLYRPSSGAPLSIPVIPQTQHTTMVLGTKRDRDLADPHSGRAENLPLAALTAVVMCEGSVDMTHKCSLLPFKGETGWVWCHNGKVVARDGPGPRENVAEWLAGRFREVGEGLLGAGTGGAADREVAERRAKRRAMRGLTRLGSAVEWDAFLERARAGEGGELVMIVFTADCGTPCEVGDLAAKRALNRLPAGQEIGRYDCREDPTGACAGVTDRYPTFMLYPRGSVPENGRRFGGAVDEDALYRAITAPLSSLSLPPHGAVQEIDSFLSAEEAEAVVAFGESLRGAEWIKSEVRNDDLQVAAPSVRNSTTLPIRPPVHCTGADLSKAREQGLLPRAVYDAIVQRAAALVGVEPERVEYLMLIRYLPTEHYDVHHDAFGRSQTRELANNGGDRVYTIFLYLSTIPEGFGGRTVFPKLDKSFRPVAGKALLWRNMLNEATGERDSRMVHKAEPLSKDSPVSKWAMNVWIRERPYNRMHKQPNKS